ncbi:hypothetical protein Tco_0017813 [Tanacetum coccineum]
MAEASSHNTSSPKITPKEEPVSLDKPKSPNPFLHATQVEFTFKEISFTTNNEVALLSLTPNQNYFKTLEDFKVWVSTPTGKVRGDIGYNGEIGAKGTLKKSYLPPREIIKLTKGSVKIWRNRATGDLKVISTNWRPSLTLFPVLHLSVAELKEHSMGTSEASSFKLYQFYFLHWREAMTKDVSSVGQATASPAKGGETPTMLKQT